MIVSRLTEEQQEDIWMANALGRKTQMELAKQSKIAQTRISVIVIKHRRNAHKKSTKNLINALQRAIKKVQRGEM